MLSRKNIPIGIAVILSGLSIIGCGPSPEEQAATSAALTAAAATDIPTPSPTPSPTPTEIPPTVTPSPSPMPTFTPTPEPQVVLLRGAPGCERDINIIANIPIQLHYGIWGSIGKARAEASWDLLDVALRMNGELIKGEKQPVTADLVKPCGRDEDDSYWQFYIANIEGIPPGVHYLEVTYYAHDVIDDGTGRYSGPGTILTHSYRLYSSTE